MVDQEKHSLLRTYNRSELLHGHAFELLKEAYAHDPVIREVLLAVEYLQNEVEPCEEE